MAKLLKSLAGLALLAGCATTPGDEVILQLDHDPVVEASGSTRIFLSFLPSIDPEDFSVQPGGFEAQILSSFGREDLLSAIEYPDFTENPCPAAQGAGDPVEVIAEMARETTIVMLNEHHGRSAPRAFALEVAKRLKPLGYQTFAAETFSSSPIVADSTEPPQSSVSERPDEAFFRNTDGGYLAEATFGRLGRYLKEEGFELVAYEYVPPEGTEHSDDIAERINTREAGQTENLLRGVLRADPDRKILILVGHGHNVENARAMSEGGKFRWFAMRVKEATGIDPLTVTSLQCRHVEGPAFVAQPPEDLGRDLAISLPVDRFEHGRPVFRQEMGDVPVAVPDQLMPQHDGWHVIEARQLSDPDEAVAMDTLAVKRGDDVKLMLPPGTYRVRAIDLGPAPDTDDQDS